MNVTSSATMVELIAGASSLCIVRSLMAMEARMLQLT